MDRRVFLTLAAQLIGLVQLPYPLSETLEASPDQVPRRFIDTSEQLTATSPLDRHLALIYWLLLKEKYGHGTIENFISQFENKPQPGTTDRVTFKGIKQDLLILWLCGDLKTLALRHKAHCFRTALVWKHIDISAPGLAYGLDFDEPGRVKFDLSRSKNDSPLSRK